MYLLPVTWPLADTVGHGHAAARVPQQGALYAAAHAIVTAASPQRRGPGLLVWHALQEKAPFPLGLPSWGEVLGQGRLPRHLLASRTPPSLGPGLHSPHRILTGDPAPPSSPLPPNTRWRR